MKALRIGNDIFIKNKGIDAFIRPSEEPIEHYERRGKILRVLTSWPDGLRIVSTYYLKDADPLYYERGVFTKQVPYSDRVLIDSKVYNWREQDD